MRDRKRLAQPKIVLVGNLVGVILVFLIAWAYQIDGQVSRAVTAAAVGFVYSGLFIGLWRYQHQITKQK